MIKRADQILDHFFEAPLSADTGQETHNSLPLPTLDERVNLYLNAVYGPRPGEFSNEERNEARILLLDEMASNIRSSDPEEVPLPAPPPPIEPREPTPLPRAYRSSRIEDFPLTALSARLPASEEISHFEEESLAKLKAELAQAREELLQFKQQSQALLKKLTLDLEQAHKEVLYFKQASVATAHAGYSGSGGVAAVAAALRRDADFQVRPKSRQTKRAAIVLTATAASLFIAAIIVFPPSWFGLENNLSGSRIVAQWPSPDERTSRQEAPTIQLESSSQSASRAPTRVAPKMEPQAAAELLKRGNDLMAAGNIPAARVVFKQAADGGSADAALALGATYDPAAIEEQKKTTRQAPTRAPGAWPAAVPLNSDNASYSNVSMARVWYERARDLGSAEAADRLKRLSAPWPQPPARQ